MCSQCVCTHARPNNADHSGHALLCYCVCFARSLSVERFILLTELLSPDRYPSMLLLPHESKGQQALRGLAGGADTAGDAAMVDTEWEGDAKTAAAQVGCSYRQAGSRALCASLQTMDMPHNTACCSAVSGSLSWDCHSSADCIVGLFCVHNITPSLLAKVLHQGCGWLVALHAIPRTSYRC